MANRSTFWTWRLPTCPHKATEVIPLARSADNRHLLVRALNNCDKYCLDTVSIYVSGRYFRNTPFDLIEGLPIMDIQNYQQRGDTYG